MKLPFEENPAYTAWLEECSTLSIDDLLRTSDLAIQTHQAVLHAVRLYVKTLGPHNTAYLLMDCIVELVGRRADEQPND